MFLNMLRLLKADISGISSPNKDVWLLSAHRKDRRRAERERIDGGKRKKERKEDKIIEMEKERIRDSTVEFPEQ